MKVKKDLILNKSILFFLLFIVTISFQAQIINKIFIEGSPVVKYSVAKETSENFKFRDNINVNVPKNSKFDSPVFGLNFSLNYQINKSYVIGIGSGINVVHKDKHPILSKEYYDRIMLPIFIKFRYQNQFSDNWLFITDINSGIQLSQFLYGISYDTYDYEENGGLLANLDVGIGKKLGKYTPILKVGYEINQFRRIERISRIDKNLQEDDKIEFRTYYQLIKFSLSIKI